MKYVAIAGEPMEAGPRAIFHGEVESFAAEFMKRGITPYIVNMFGPQASTYSYPDRRQIESLPGSIDKFFIATAAMTENNSIVGNTDDVIRNIQGLYNARGEPVRPVNSLRVMRAFLPKHYLAEHTQSGLLPVIPSTRVDSIEDLLALKKDADKWLVKPLVGECSIGATALTDLNEDDLESYWNQYQHDSHPLGQGIVAQPYLKGFREHGERKIGVVNGEFTLSRIHFGSMDEKIVAVTKGATVARHEPTKSERDLAMNVYEWANQEWGAQYCRVDLVQDGDTSKISEIEVVDPIFAVRRPIFSKEDIDTHIKQVMHILS